MSEFINNSEMRKQALKDILRQIHEGKSFEEVKSGFAAAFHGVGANEISKAEAALIEEGLPVAEIQNLCDVHAAVFKGSIEQIHAPVDLSSIPGHPLNVLVLENRRIQNVIDEMIRPHFDTMDKKAILAGLEELSRIDRHYLKKENLLFPYMEQYGITAPPKVMWGVDDKIKKMLKDAKLEILNDDSDLRSAVVRLEEALIEIEEMIYKEENIMVPILVENLTDKQWQLIAHQSGEIGYLIDEVPQFDYGEVHDDSSLKELQDQSGVGKIILPSGSFEPDELVAMLDTLPFDITFVDKNDEVKYFSEGKDRAFPRTRTIIGRKVSNCHPPQSVHVVESIVADFKSGKKDHEDFWIRFQGKYVLIRYFAVRNHNGEYLGVIEVTQDIQDIQAITGEKRLMD
ncbi:MAG: DUF438 domain-containing protein [Erysipelotrichaceae bacterium]|nr:DUF438 domain-containing protein [Erysipelotrichaceae bacterium]